MECFYLFYCGRIGVNVGLCTCTCVRQRLVLFRDGLVCFILRQLQSRLVFASLRALKTNKEDMQPHLIRGVVRRSADDFSKLAWKGSLGVWYRKVVGQAMIEMQELCIAVKLMLRFCLHNMISFTFLATWFASENLTLYWILRKIFTNNLIFFFYLIIEGSEKLSRAARIGNARPQSEACSILLWQIEAECVIS